MKIDNIKTVCFFETHSRAFTMLEIFNAMNIPYVSIRGSKGWKVKVALSEKEIGQLKELGFYTVNV